MGNPTQDFDIKIAQISSPNGLKGHVKLLIFLDFKEDILSFNNIFDQKSLQYKISPISKKEDHWIVKIQGIDSREKAEALKNTTLYIKRSSLPTLSENQFYYEDLISMAVFKDDIQIGIVKSVSNFGAGDLLEIQLNNSVDTIYHPFSNGFIKSIDQLSKKISIISID